MTWHNKYLDTKENLLKLKEALPYVIDSIRSGQIVPGFNRMFESPLNDHLLFTFNADAPCCTMGHLLKKAGLEREITSFENEQMPNVLFGDTDLCAAVTDVAAVNDSDYDDESIRKADIVHELEKLEGTINEALERL